MPTFQEMIAESNGPRSLEGHNYNKVFDETVFYGAVGALGCFASSLVYGAGRDLLNKSVDTVYRYAPYPAPYSDTEQTIVINDQMHTLGNTLVNSSVPLLVASLFCVGMGLLKASEVSKVKGYGKKLPRPNEVVSSDGVVSFEWDMLADRQLVPEDGIRFIWDGDDSSDTEADSVALNGNDADSSLGTTNGNGYGDSQRLERAKELADFLAKEQELKQRTSEV